MVSTDQELVMLMDCISTTVDQPASFRMLEIVDAGGQPQFHEILPIFFDTFLSMSLSFDSSMTYPPGL